MKLHFIVASHNRARLTDAAVRSVIEMSGGAKLPVSVVVFDDGSIDGTLEKLQKYAPICETISGDGSAFWARAMATAEAYSLRSANGSKGDYIVWLNDDVRLDADALHRMLEVALVNPEAILVGAMRDTRSPGLVTYSGLAKFGIHPLGYRRVEPSVSECRAIESFNGNFVWIPVKVARILGGIDGQFAHSLADIDYGLRARRANFDLLLAPGTFGTCERNAPAGLSGSLWEEWAHFRSVKGGGHRQSVARFFRKHNRWPRISLIILYAGWWVKRFA